eukprot:scaffold4058_cov121-Isochrysis_galbana.AAC.7
MYCRLCGSKIRRSVRSGLGDRPVRVTDVGWAAVTCGEESDNAKAGGLALLIHGVGVEADCGANWRPEDGDRPRGEAAAAGFNEEG